MSKYLEMPWSIEDTIENLKELKHGLKERCIIQNLHGRGEKDAEEVAFDFDRAIKALEEVQQYRAIGTVEECRVAMEKQKAKKPQKTESAGYRYTDTYRCPNCGGNFTGTGIAGYCYHCGQKLDWS